jgi:hypothetical protein
MTERIGISLILLVIAVAHLVTDVARLALEVSPRPGFNHPGPVPTRSGEQEMPPSGRSIILAQCRPTRHSTDCLRISASISRRGARHAGVAIHPDMREGPGMSGKRDAWGRPGPMVNDPLSPPPEFDC